MRNYLAILYMLRHSGNVRAIAKSGRDMALPLNRTDNHENQRVLLSGSDGSVLH